MMYWIFPFLQQFVTEICDWWWHLSQAVDSICPGLGDFVFGIYEWLFC